MEEVRVKEGEELNGLGLIIKHAMDTNLEDPKISKSIQNFEATVVVKDTSSGAAVTIHFQKGDIEMRNGAISKPSTTFKGHNEQLGKVILGEVGPIRSVLTLKTRASGNLLKLMKASKVMILKNGV